MSVRTRLLAPLAALLLAACATGGATSEADQAPSPAAGSTGATTNQPWPVKTRLHVDLWLHGFAMVQDDTARVPYFKRGYRDQLVVRRNQANVTTQLDRQRDSLRLGFRRNPGLQNAQFAALPAESWDEMKQVAELFLRAEGDPQRASNAQVAQVIAQMAAYFPSPADRAWFARFMNALEDERVKFYQAYWTQEQRDRAPVLAAVDSTWHRVVRPKIQAFLNNTQQASGSFVASLPIGGEGRTVSGGKQYNLVVTNFPERPEDALHASFTFAHEAALNISQGAVNDNVTPAERREGVADRHNASAAVIGGWLLMRRVSDAMADEYARYYLRAAGRPAPAGSPTAALEATFPLPAAIRDAIARQIEITFGGI